MHSILNTHPIDRSLPLKTFSFSCLFLRQRCRDVASGIDSTEIYFRLQIWVIESSSLVSILFIEVFSHPYISFIHLLVNVCFCVIIIILISRSTFLFDSDEISPCSVNKYLQNFYQSEAIFLSACFWHSYHIY